MENLKDTCKEDRFKKVCEFAKKHKLKCEIYADGKVGQTDLFPTESTHFGMRCSGEV
ncbi:hypothetical protein HYT26_03940 [Candidatus Pacearchaeota archaeon]|nr:hypothetical protein [Candidatus Pacearchaeota archaeon]